MDIVDEIIDAFVNGEPEKLLAALTRVNPTVAYFSMMEAVAQEKALDRDLWEPFMDKMTKEKRSKFYHFLSTERLNLYITSKARKNGEEGLSDYEEWITGELVNRKFTKKYVEKMLAKIRKNRNLLCKTELDDFPEIEKEFLSIQDYKY